MYTPGQKFMDFSRLAVKPTIGWVFWDYLNWECSRIILKMWNIIHFGSVAKNNEQPFKFPMFTQFQRGQNVEM